MLSATLTQHFRTPKNLTQMKRRTICPMEERSC